MAMTSDTRRVISRLARFILLTPDAAGLAAFYAKAFGCKPQSGRQVSAARLTELGIDGDAVATSLELGHQTIELIQCAWPGRSIPAEASSCDLAFQHFAIVVSDMGEAYRRLCNLTTWHAISVSGPQRLPDSAGGVTAFKFRDPDGHPLELVAFPRDQMPMHWRQTPEYGGFVGIDHSAISVSDAVASVAFYEALGLCVTSRSFNQGSEQARLDKVYAPQVDVISLAPKQATPHLELLAYRGVRRARSEIPGANDVAATRLVFETDDSQTASVCLIDPDGHRIVIEPRSPTRATGG